MVKQDIRQTGIGEEFLSCIAQSVQQRRESIICWGENCKRSFCAQGIYQSCLDDSCLKDGMVRAVDNYVNNSRLGS